MTAVAASTILEGQALPLLSASAAEVPSAQTHENNDDAATPADSVSTPAPNVVAPQITVTPEVSEAVQVYTESANVKVSTGQPVAVEPAPAAPPPVAVERSVPKVNAAPSASNLPIATSKPEPPALENPAASPIKPQIIPTLPSEASVQQKPESAPQSHGSGENPATTPKESPINQARQTLEKRLASMVEQGRSTKEDQFRQNLIVAAIQYAQMGNFEQARQIAHNPALSLEMQKEILLNIAQLEAQWKGQSPTLNAQQLAGTVKKATANSAPANAAASQANGLTAAAPSNTAAPDYWVVPSTPAMINPYLSDRCISQTTLTQKPAAPTPHRSATPPAKPEPVAAIVRQLSQQSAANLARFGDSSGLRVGASFAQTGSALTKFLPSSPVAAAPATAAKPSTPIAKPAQALVQPKGAAVQISHQQTEPLTAQAPLKQSLTQPPKLKGSLVEATQRDEKLDKTIVTTLEASQPFEKLEKLGLSLPKPLATAVQSVLANWMNFAETKGLPTDLSLDPPSALDEATQSAVAEGLIERPYLQQIQQDLVVADAADRPVPTPSPQKAPAAKQRVKTTPAVQLVAASATPDFTRVLNVNCSEFQSAEAPKSYWINPELSKQQGWVSMMFPLPIPAVITSIFGWRVHPITGDRRFHTGVDMGAPMGTPIMAALAGRVVSADYMGGYGLAVIIENAAGTFRNLYGHMSAIAVQPGTWIEKGTVIGMVGSTGSSTGPHLHFESLVLHDGAWTAVDPLAAAALSVAQAK